MSFMFTYTDVRTAKFSRLSSPDWSIQISHAPAVCREVLYQNLLHNTWTEMSDGDIFAVMLKEMVDFKPGK